MKTKSLTCLAVCLGVMLIVGIAQASEEFHADVWADINWDSLVVTLEEGMSIDYTPSDSYSAASVENSNGEFDEAIEDLPGWVDTSAAANISDALSSASTNNTLLTSTAYADQPVVNETGESAYAESEVWRDGEFQITGSGTVTFEIAYELEVDLAANLTGMEATGYSGAWLILENIDADEMDEQNDFSENTLAGPDTSLENLPGTFTVSLYFEDGDSGYFDTGTLTYAETIAPEPTTFVLLAFGGLLLKRRGKKTHR